MEPLTYDPSGVIAGVIDERYGLQPGDLEQLADRLGRARDEVLDDVRLWRSGQPVPDAKQPLDAAFVHLPQQLLTEWQEHEAASVLGRIRASADRLARTVDRVVVLGIGGSYMGARALFEACCHPYHNELDRQRRHGRPRLYFAGNNVDNDATSGLLDLLADCQWDKGVTDRWAIVVISKSGGTLETAVAFRQFLAALRASCGGDDRRVAELVVPVTGPEGRLADLAEAIGCPERFVIPDGVGGRYSVLTAVGLLPAAVLGLDMVGLLQGARSINEHFETEPVGRNVVLDYTGVCHLMEQQQGAIVRVLSAWSNGLEGLGLWYDQLLAESLGKQQRGALPITVVNTRDLHSRGQQHQEGRRDKLITNLVVDNVRRDPLPVGRMGWDHDQLDALADRTLPEIMAAALAGTNKAYAEDGRPTADLHVPNLEPTSMGQLFQMFMLSTVAEGRLIGVNPYGQPGVEAYKRHMNDLLRSTSRDGQPN